MRKPMEILFQWLSSDLPRGPVCSVADEVGSAFWHEQHAVDAEIAGVNVPQVCQWRGKKPVE